jgi:hypothetical protein
VGNIRHVTVREIDLDVAVTDLDALRIADGDPVRARVIQQGEQCSGRR